MQFVELLFESPEGGPGISSSLTFNITFNVNVIRKNNALYSDTEAVSNDSQVSKDIWFNI